jgi:hypothetical protein
VNKTILTALTTLCFGLSLVAQTGPGATTEPQPAPQPTDFPLPTPLVLPPGNIEVLQIDTNGSFMGDAPRIVDCPKNSDNPFGVCGNVLFGGVGLWNSHLSGSIQVRFFPPVNQISHFEISHPFDLTGTDTVLSTPQLYQYPATGNVILDTFNGYSSGDLNLVTGQVTNLNYQVIFSNSWYKAFAGVNPKLFPPAFGFPGVYGSANLVFTQRADGNLDLTFYGSTFLPLGNNIDGDPVRLPMPFTGPALYSPSIQVPGLSLHPHLSITTVPSTTPTCGMGCPKLPANQVIQLTLNSAVSSLGDDFYLNVPALGGFALGRSQMLGRIEVQFGTPVGNFVPIAINPLPPEGLLATPPAFPIAGLSLGFLGFDEDLVFPNLTYHVDGPAITDDPFDFCVGELNLTTGFVQGELLWRTFWTHDLLQAILAQNNGRILPTSFEERGPAWFQIGPNNSLVFRYNASSYLDYTGFVFPGPDYGNSAHSFTALTGSYLTPFYRMQSEMITDTPATVFTNSASITSTFGQAFTYSMNIPCSGQGESSFTYTNNNARPSTGTLGGTFTMTNLASVSCTNSLTSKLPAGQYDTIAFSGYGTWSNDKSPHLATVAFSKAADAPYIGIQIDGASLSNADTKPVTPPQP